MLPCIGSQLLEAIIATTILHLMFPEHGTLGPALVSGQLDTLSICLTAPVVGMFLACPTCSWIQGSDCCTPKQEG